MSTLNTLARFATVVTVVELSVIAQTVVPRLTSVAFFLLDLSD